MTRKTRHLAIFALAAAASIAAAVPAVAYHGSSDHSGYMAECSRLYMKRNNFFHKKGLCFTRPAAVEIFGTDCTYRSSEDMPMTNREKRWVAAIVAEERELGCPRL